MSNAATPEPSFEDAIAELEQVVRTLEFSVLAKYAFSLAQAFNGFYNLPPARSSILNEERPDVQRHAVIGGRGVCGCQ